MPPIQVSASVTGNTGPVPGVATLAPIKTNAKASIQKKDLNIFFVVMDDNGIEKWQAYLAYTGATAPVIRVPNIKNKVIIPGLTCNNFWASPVCGPFRAGLQSGLYAHHCGFWNNITDNMAQATSNYYLGQDPSDTTTLTKQLITCMGKAIDNARPNKVYKKGFFGKNHCSEQFGHDNWPTLNAGWDRFYGHMSGQPIDHLNLTTSHYIAWDYVQSTTAASPDVATFGGDGTGTMRTRVTNTWDCDKSSQDAIAWLDTIGTHPFVLMWTPATTHAPYECPDPTRVGTGSKNDWATAFGASGIDQNGNPWTTYPTIGQNFSWTGEVGSPLPSDSNFNIKIQQRVMIEKHACEATDSCFLDIWNKINSLGKIDDTVIMVMVDNGTEVDIVEPPFINTHFKRSVYEGGIHCPLFIQAPAIMGQPGRTTNELVQSVDLFATVMDIIGGYPAGLNSDIPGQLPVIRDPSAKSSRIYNFAYLGNSNNGSNFNPSTKRFSSPNGAFAISDGVYKYIRIVGASTTHRLFLQPNFLETDSTDLMIIAPLDPATISNKARLSAAMDGIMNS